MRREVCSTLVALIAASTGCSSAHVSGSVEPTQPPPMQPPMRVLGPKPVELAAPPRALVVDRSQVHAEMNAERASAVPPLQLVGAAPARVDEALARCPAEMALVDERVCVDRWESHLLIFDDGREVAWSPYEPVDGMAFRFRAVSRPDAVPQGYISGDQARAACSASGKRLCGPAEWERACRGPENLAYPYGRERQANACNDDGRAMHPVVEAGRTLGLEGGSYWREGMNQPLINQLPDSLAPTGSAAACRSAEGVYDLVGNLHEWVDDPSGTFRGGYYMDTAQNGEGCSYQTTAHDAAYHDYSTGFRCCLDPDLAD